MYSMLYNFLVVWQICYHSSTSAFAFEEHPHWSLLPYDSCGLAPRSVDSRVMGGQDAILGEFPWMVNIFPTVEGLRLHQPDCGGSLISSRYVLTAAHCCEDLKPDTSSVRVGEYDLSDRGPDCRGSVCAEQVVDVAVEELTIHQNYSDIQHYDICLIRLKQTVKFSDFIQPICLPVYENLRNKSFVGEEMQLAGWGYSDKYPTSQTPVLQTVSLHVVSEEDCQLEYYSVGPNELCAGGLVQQQLRLFCIGDSGGPLMRRVQVHGKERWVVFGVVSWLYTEKLAGKLTCKMAVPGVFTRVTEYTGWLLDNIRS